MIGILTLGLRVSLILLAGLCSFGGTATAVRAKTQATTQATADATETEAAPSSVEPAIASLPETSRAGEQAAFIRPDEGQSGEGRSDEGQSGEERLDEEQSGEESSAHQPDEGRAEEPHLAAAPQLLNWNNYPVDLFLLDPDIDPQDYGVITNRTVSQASLTTPSLWWTQDQFGDKLLEHWLAYPGSETEPRRVDLVVDRQIWSLSSYLERYTFINRFGTAAKSFGYNIRVFNDQGSPQASYICNFQAPLLDEQAIANAEVPDPQEVDCDVSLNSSGAGALRGQSGGFESLF
ncbi:MAG: hypothetical protein WBA57_01310 [Elainellaceae cyanobacterium]